MSVQEKLGAILGDVWGRMGGALRYVPTVFSPLKNESTHLRLYSRRQDRDLSRHLFQRVAGEIQDFPLDGATRDFVFVNLIDGHGGGASGQQHGDPGNGSDFRFCPRHSFENSFHDGRA